VKGTGFAALIAFAAVLALFVLAPTVREDLLLRLTSLKERKQVLLLRLLDQPDEVLKG
jgi:hypothetical protein